jgi:cyclopropane fatty-acyl-phospholipid synthase-like methyltransferase
VRRLFFAFRYLTGRVPWDTNVTPPELVELIQTGGLAEGHALELGCGTGTNAIYMAQHGWQVTAIDFVARAISRARRKSRRAKVRQETRFLVGDATRLRDYDLPTFDLVLDIGCLHTLAPEQRPAYASGLSAVVRPGATFLLYAFQPREGTMGPMGLTPDEVRDLFAPHFRVAHVEHGQNEVNQMASAWYRLERVP